MGTLLSRDERREATQYNKSQPHLASAASVRDLQRQVGADVDGLLGPQTAERVAQWQSKNKLAIDGKVGPNTWAAVQDAMDSGSCDPSPTPDRPVTPPPSGEGTLLEEFHELAESGTTLLNLDGPAIKSAVSHMERYVPIVRVRLLQETLGLVSDGIPGPNTVKAVAQWQALAGFYPVDGVLGPDTRGSMRDHGAWPPVASKQETVPLTDDAVATLMHYTKFFESGGSHKPLDEVYGASNTNAEWEGWFDRPKRDKAGNKLSPAQRAKHPASAPHWASRFSPNGGTMIGLSFGAWQGTQHGGTLADISLAMYHADQGLFTSIFGGESRVRALLRTLTAPREPRDGARAPRTQKVLGEDVWEGEWLAAYKETAKHEVFRQAQRDVIASEYLSGAFKYAIQYGFRDSASLAVLFDMCIQFGVGGAGTYIKRGMDRTDHVGAEAIDEVIRDLADARQPRRVHILRIADPFVTFTVEELRGWKPPLPKSKLRGWWDDWR